MFAEDFLSHRNSENVL